MFSGLFARFLLLFSTTSLLVALLLAAMYYILSEEQAITTIEKRYNLIIALFNNIEKDGLVDNNIYRYAEEIKGEVTIKSGGALISSSDQSPNIDILLDNAIKLQDIYFKKFNGGYYLLYQKNDYLIAITSSPFNMMVYSRPFVYWPWIVLFLVLFVSNLVLAMLLKPIKEVLSVVKSVSNGDFSRRIEHHPSNELSILTYGINNMTEDIEEMFESKNELLLAISHELRTPITRMVLKLAMSEDNEMNSSLKSDLRIMELLIEQLLEGERLTAGHRALHLSNVYLPMFFSEILFEHSRNSIILDGDIPEVAIKVDMGRIKFLFRNIISNALKHGSSSLPCKISFQETQEVLIVNIQDFGKGIPEYALSKIFEPFYQVTDIKNRSNNGVGLGLYLCDKICKAHKGSIKVASEVSKGTIFSISLPFDCTKI